MQCFWDDLAIVLCTPHSHTGTAIVLYDELMDEAKSLPTVTSGWNISLSSYFKPTTGIAGGMRYMKSSAIATGNEWA